MLKPTSQVPDHRPNLIAIQSVEYLSTLSYLAEVQSHLLPNAL